MWTGENEGFQIRSPGWRLLKTEIHRILVDGVKTEVFKYDEVMLRFNAPALPHIRFEKATCGRKFF